MGAFVRCGLLLLLLCLLTQGQRISELKCSEYRKETVQTTAIIPLTLNPRPILFHSFNCTKAVDLIVGGEAAKPAEFPHHALLGWPKDKDPYDYNFWCGGSLISDQFVLTAAHCFKSSSPQIVRLAEYSLKDAYDNAVDIDIDSIVKHPKYRPTRSYNDIALVKLEDKVRFSQYIRPACLWTGHDVNITSVIATGFGHTELAGNQSDVLMKVMLDLLEAEECTKQYNGSRPFPRGVIPEQLCVGSKRGGKDACQGDSGGPIQVVTEPKGCTYHVIGVTSTGTGCGIGRSPSIYTRVADYIGWIEDTVWK